MESYRAVVVTDLDGTLLNSQRRISTAGRRLLRELGEAGVCRIAATGRSPYSVRRVLIPADPFDYVVVSSGVGTIEWSSQCVLHSTSLSAAETIVVVRLLRDLNVNFMVHEPLPDNHRFSYHEARPEATDFRRRCEFYQGFHERLTADSVFDMGASQCLAVIPPDMGRLAALRSHLSSYSVIRTTSPIDHHSIWVEIFPAGVSKASACARITRQARVDPTCTYALGNDYNDVELLEWAGQARVTANAPPDLRARFGVVPSNDEDGFCHAVSAWRLSRPC